MNIKIVGCALRDYKRKKSMIETTLERIEVFKKAINNPDKYRGLFLGQNKEPGMPRGTSQGSEVEFKLLTKEQERELIKNWIKDDKSRIYPLQIELEQIDVAMNALTNQERYIIECKYFEGMIWRDIEISFNNKLRQKNYITVAGIRKMNTESLKLLAKILEPYYNRFKIKK